MRSLGPGAAARYGPGVAGGENCEFLIFKLRNKRDGPGSAAGDGPESAGGDGPGAAAAGDGSGLVGNKL